MLEETSFVIVMLNECIYKSNTSPCQINVTDAINDEGKVFPPRPHEFTHGFSNVHVAGYLVLCVVFF